MRRQKVGSASSAAGALGVSAQTVYGPYRDSKSGAWRVVVTDSQGARSSVSRPTEQEASLLLRAIQEEIAKRTVITLGEAIEQYLDYKARSGLRPVSLRTIRDKLRTIFPDASRNVSQLSVRECRALYDDFSRRYAVATHQAMLKSAKEFFAWLTERGLIAESPFVGIRPIGRPNVGKTQLSQREAQTLVGALSAAAESSDEGALALLLQLYTGMRSGEVLGLLASQVETVQDAGGNPVTQISILRGKTANSRRRIRVPETLAQTLLRRCLDLRPIDRVFATSNGKQPTTIWLYKRLRTWLRRLGLTQCCPHSLRGLYATLAIEGGATCEAVAKSLGHSSFTVTAKHYADPSAVLNARQAGVVAALAPNAQTSGVRPQVMELLKTLTPEEFAVLRGLL